MPSDMVPVYAACLIFGGIFLLVSLFTGHGHGASGDLHDVGTDHAHGHDASHDGHVHGIYAALLPFLSLRFWILGTTFFGLTGLLLALVSALPATVILGVSIASGMGLGMIGTRLLQRLTAETVGRAPNAAQCVGREGTLLLPAGAGQRGKVRVPSGDRVLDLTCESDGAQALPVGTKVIVVDVRGATAYVERSPVAEPNKEST